MDSNKLSPLAVVPISKTNQESVSLPSEIATNAYDTEPSTAILEVAESNVTPNPSPEAPHPFLLTPPTNDDSSRSPSVHNAVLARRNLLSHIRDNYRTISRTNRILLITNFVFSFLMVTAMIVVLIVTRNQACDRPLRSFLALNVFKYGFGIPLMLVHYLHPDGRFPQYSSSVWVQWADRTKSLLDFVGVFFFIMGNYFLFTSSTCEFTAPPLFGMSLAMIILGYFMVAIPVLLCTAAVFCLPCALIVLRTFRIGPDGGSGAKPDEIKSIALLKYRYGSSTHPPNTSTQMTSVTSVPLPHKPSFLSKLKSKLSQEKKPCLDEFIDMREISNLPEFRVANTEDALCVICLEEYRDGELIRKPRCNHHFHRQCLDEWLLINKYCPLCKADVFPSGNDSP